jgi:hypothetical protein
MHYSTRQKKKNNNPSKKEALQIPFLSDQPASLVYNFSSFPLSTRPTTPVRSSTPSNMDPPTLSNKKGKKIKKKKPKPNRIYNTVSRHKRNPAPVLGLSRFGFGNTGKKSERRVAHVGNHIFILFQLVGVYVSQGCGQKHSFFSACTLLGSLSGGGGFCFLFFLSLHDESPVHKQIKQGRGGGSMSKKNS